MTTSRRRLLSIFNQKVASTSLPQRVVRVRTSVWFSAVALIVYVAGADWVGGKQSNELVTNGSFEEGEREPLEWKRGPAGARSHFILVQSRRAGRRVRT
jgi:hypothetical protein